MCFILRNMLFSYITHISCLQSLEIRIRKGYFFMFIDSIFLSDFFKEKQFIKIIEKYFFFLFDTYIYWLQYHKIYLENGIKTLATKIKNLE